MVFIGCYGYFMFCICLWIFLIIVFILSLVVVNWFDCVLEYKVLVFWLNFCDRKLNLCLIGLFLVSNVCVVVMWMFNWLSFFVILVLIVIRVSFCLIWFVLMLDVFVIMCFMVVWMLVCWLLWWLLVIVLVLVISFFNWLSLWVMILVNVVFLVLCIVEKLFSRIVRLVSSVVFRWLCVFCLGFVRMFLIDSIFVVVGVDRVSFLLLVDCLMVFRVLSMMFKNFWFMLSDNLGFLILSLRLSVIFLCVKCFVMVFWIVILNLLILFGSFSWILSLCVFIDWIF